MDYYTLTIQHTTKGHHITKTKIRHCWMLEKGTEYTLAVKKPSVTLPDSFDILAVNKSGDALICKVTQDTWMRPVKYRDGSPEHTSVEDIDEEIGWEYEPMDLSGWTITEKQRESN